jgi:hypothetical protein
MRTFLAAVLALGAGCCWQIDQACVVGSPSMEACVDMSTCFCPLSETVDDGPAAVQCTDLRDGSCADNGFTAYCGGYAVRPGSGC